MSDIQILMPMGGLGSRFAKQGYSTPKPLIKVDGKPMFRRALESFRVLDARFLFVIREDQDREFAVAEQIRKEIPDALITLLTKNTRGAVETAMHAESTIDDSLPIIIADCDIYFESEDYFRKIKYAAQKGKPDAVLLTFQSSDPRYSYAQTDDSGRLIRTAEKIVISNNAILGGYFFSSGKLFKNLARDFLYNGLPAELKEYYLSHLFNILLKKRGVIEIASVDTMYIFGTPEELNAYFAQHPQK